jgi:hypothetical protein
MPAGLCESCRHHTWITSGRGSRFLRCDLSFIDPRFARFPALPVFACAGYSKGEPGVEKGPEEAVPE